jgi:TusE/DsrC/DsvC family sulfur relay protein
MQASVTAAGQETLRRSAPDFDERGYLVDTQHWNPALAEALAFEAGIARLTPAHWRVIDHVRRKYFTLGSLPVMRLVCRAAGVDPDTAQNLFSGCASLWRIAGLPHPGEEALAYMH